jgi:outer membrane protein assembly factor BamB
VFEPLLPLVAHHLLEPEEKRQLQAHVADCAHCRAWLAGYDRLDAALRRSFEQVAVSLPNTEEIMKEIEAQEPAVPLSPVPPMRQRDGFRTSRVFSWAGALAVVLVIALMTTALIASHRPSTTGTKPSDGPPAGAAAGVYFSATTANSPQQTSIYALNPENGAVRWRVKMPTDVMSIPTLIDHGVLYVLAQDYSAVPSKDPNQNPTGGTSAKNAVYALRASDGKLLWHSQTGSIPYLVMLGDGGAYVATANGAIYALDVSNGSVKWHVSVGDSKALMQVADDVLYISAYRVSSKSAAGGKLIALNTSDGSVKWRYDLQGSANYVEAFNGQVAVLDTEMVANQETVNLANRFVMLNASDGSVKWRYQGDPKTVGAAFVQQNTVYVTLLRGSGKEQYATKLQALNASDGSLRWEKSYANFNVLLPDHGSQGGKVYLTANNMIFALNAQDGNEAWNARFGDMPDVQKLANGVLFAQAQGGLYALNADDGSVIWHDALGNAVFLTAATNQQVYGMAKNTDPQQHWLLRFFAIDARTGKPLWHYDATMYISAPIVG